MIDPRDRVTCSMVDECERLDYALYLACHELTDVLGTCPFNQHDWDGCDCDEKCSAEIDMDECWVAYFKGRVE